MCVECLIGKQKKPILFKVTEPSSVQSVTVSLPLPRIEVGWEGRQTAKTSKVGLSYRRRQSGFALQATIEGRAAEAEHVRVVALPWHFSGSEVRLSLPVGLLSVHLCLTPAQDSVRPSIE